MKSLLAFVLGAAVVAGAQPGPDQRQQFIKVDALLIALTHVRVIDGTGAAARDDQTLVISGGKIQSVGTAPPPAEAKVLDLRGYSVIPGLVGMHDHMFFPMGGNPPIYGEMGSSFPRLYLAAGVTTIRTAGSIEPFTDLELKKLIDAGRILGPKMHVTGPYLEGPGAYTPDMHELKDAGDARRMVNFWADEGATSFKAYMHITREELRAAAEEVHQRGLKITGHLCSIGFKEAAELGIDDLEHGLVVDTEFVPGKQPDQCPSSPATRDALVKLDVAGAPVQEMIRALVARHVALTSTLPVFEASVPNAPAGTRQRPLTQERVLDAMSTDARARYLGARARVPADSPSGIALKKEMEFEHAFAQAGGLLLAGLDPTGNGGVVAGFGDQREVELLVEAGFTPLEAIKIASYNGALFLGEQDHIGSIAASKQADLVVIHGDPSANINDLEKVEIVFKDGIGYDAPKLIDSVRGLVGIR